MNIKTIKRRKEVKDKLVQKWYKMMKPLANYIDYREDKKYKKRREKAKQLSDEEAIDLVVKSIIKKVGKYGRLDEEIAICTWSDEGYNSNIFDFIEYINWNNANKLLNEWHDIHYDYINTDINYIERLTELLEQKLKDIDGIKVECYIEDNVYDWKYKNYIKTLKISLEESEKYVTNR